MKVVHRVYLAGPDVFRSDALEHGQRLKAICRAYQLHGLLPLDNDLADGRRKSEFARCIFKANLDMIAAADALICNMTPFRGPGMDGGTAFEMGYGYALEKLVVGYTDDPRDYRTRVTATESSLPALSDSFGMTIEISA